MFVRWQIYNWKPQVYNETDKLPSNMPEYLKTAIADISNEKEVKRAINPRFPLFSVLIPIRFQFYDAAQHHLDYVRRRESG